MLIAVTLSEALHWLVQNLLNPLGVSRADVVWVLERIPRFLAVLLAFYLGSKALLWILSKTILREERMEPMLAQIVERLTFAVLMAVAFAAALRVFNVNVFDLAVTLGLVGAALALGLQNTVANLMGGISLASDRPFEVGDRVQIGEFWGDVEEIGLRSTRILTARREYVIIPNRLMDEREIWNYTKRYPELRLDIDVEISYDSDAELARQLMLQVANENPNVLGFPEPMALNHGFQESGVKMQLRCFIPDSREQYVVASELRDGMKDAFQSHGVEIPYPYRTLVDKSDLPKPARADETGPGERLGARRVLVMVAGSTPAIRKAETVVDLCADLDADIVLAHFTPRPSIVSERQGEMAADVYEAKAEGTGIEVKLVNETGTPGDAIGRVLERERCGAIVLGSSRSSVLRQWTRPQLEDEIRENVDVPVIAITKDLRIRDSERRAAREALDEIEEAADEP